MNIPSYQVKPGETITLTTKAMEIPAIKKLLETKKLSTPDWLARKAVVGKIKRLPVVDDISEPISTQDIIEFYSR